MHVLVHGTGAVGGYFGALLAEGGHDATFVARGANLTALRANGLRVLRGDPAKTIHIHPVRAVERPSEAPRADLVLVCVKSYDTAAAADALRPVVGPETIVLSIQNGIENEAILAERLSLPPLMIGLTRIGVELTAPGTVLYSGRGEILFGEPDGTESPRARGGAGRGRAGDGARARRATIAMPRSCGRCSGRRSGGASSAPVSTRRGAGRRAGPAR